MKSVFKIIIFIILQYSNMVHGREIILIEHLENRDTAIVVKNILINKFQIPSTLIKINGQRYSCSEKSDAILQLCILPNGEMEIKKINSYVLKNSFNIFLDQKE